MGSNAPSFYNTYHLPSSFLLSEVEHLPSRCLVPLLSYLRPSFHQASSVPFHTLDTFLFYNLLHLFTSPADWAATSSTVLRLSVASSLASHTRHFCILTTFQSLCAPIDLPSATLLFIIPWRPTGCVSERRWALSWPWHHCHLQLPGPMSKSPESGPLDRSCRFFMSYEHTHLAS